MALPQGHYSPEAGGGDGVDRISGLPEELLLQVLVRLGCAREAARTSVLARRWRGLSTRLPEYTFRGVAPESVEAALAQVTRPKLDRLDIEAELSPEAACGRASSLLLAAARLEPEKLSAVLILPKPVVMSAAAIELPCLDRTRSLVLKVSLPFKAPATGTFNRLETLEITTLHPIPDAQLSSCPRLRVLGIDAIGAQEVVTVRSTTLEELVVIALFVQRVHVEAPLLKAMKLYVWAHRNLSMSFSATEVEKLHWHFDYWVDMSGFTICCSSPISSTA